MRRWLFAGILLILTACGGAATVAPNGGAVNQATAAAPTTGSAATAAASSTPHTAAQGIVPAPGSVEATALQAVSKAMGLAPEQLRVLNKEEKEWPNSGLGCEAPDMLYMQVITSGFLINYTDGTQTYEVHTNTSGDNAVVCQNGKPVERK